MRKAPMSPPSQQPSTESASALVQPWRTKAVRLFVVPESTSKNANAMREFVANQRAAVNDVFIVGSSAMSFVNDELKPMAAAIAVDWEAVPFVVTGQREQIQWQSDVDFSITAIDRVAEPMTTLRPVEYGSPDAPREKWTFDRASDRGNPFGRLRDELGNGPVQAVSPGGSGLRAIRSGVAELGSAAKGMGQLYRLSVTITVDGKSTIVSPGIYVLAGGSETKCDRRISPKITTPNRTKVVRLLTVSATVAANPSALRELAERESLSASDFLVVDGEPKSYIDGKLKEHVEDPQYGDRSVIYVMVEELEQLQWESNTEFEVASIGKKRSSSFQQNVAAPENPFAAMKSSSDLARVIRSGVADLKEHKTRTGQLYKVTFRMMVDGVLLTVDPDAYCDM